eukprot:ctg_333.g162
MHRARPSRRPTRPPRSPLLPAASFQNTAKAIAPEGTAPIQAPGTWKHDILLSAARKALHGDSVSRSPRLRSVSAEASATSSRSAAQRGARTRDGSREDGSTESMRRLIQESESFRTIREA